MNFFLRCLQAAEPHLLAFEEDAQKLCITFAEDELVKLGNAIAAALAARNAPPAPASAPAPAEEQPPPTA